MKWTAFLYILVVITGVFAAEMESDNKATESKSSSIVTATKEEKGNKQEKRAPLIMTSVPGEVKYNPEVKYLSPPDIKTPSFYQSLAPEPAPKPQYIYYTPPTSQMPLPQQTQMVLMFAVPHPNGQFLMLLPAQNFIYPMFYRHPQSAMSSPHLQYQSPIHQSSSSSYQPNYSAPALAQSAGFAAQQQLAYSGPYRPEKYQRQTQ